MEMKPQEPSIRLPRITNGLLALIIALLFIADRIWTAVSKWHQEGIAEAFSHAKWDAAAKAISEANIPELREQQKTLWTEQEKLRAAKP